MILWILRIPKETPPGRCLYYTSAFEVAFFWSLNMVLLEVVKCKKYPDPNCHLCTTNHLNVYHYDRKQSIGCITVVQMLCVCQGLIVSDITQIIH